MPRLSRSGVCQFQLSLKQRVLDFGYFNKSRALCIIVLCLIDPATHRIGSRELCVEWLQQLGDRIDQLDCHSGKNEFCQAGQRLWNSTSTVFNAALAFL